MEAGVRRLWPKGKKSRSTRPILRSQMAGFSCSSKPFTPTHLKIGIRTRPTLPPKPTPSGKGSPADHATNLSSYEIKSGRHHDRELGFSGDCSHHPGSNAFL